jgi:hypothetical protein
VRFLPASLEQRAFPALSGDESPELCAAGAPRAALAENGYSPRVGIVEMDAPNALRCPAARCW